MKSKACFLVVALVAVSACAEDVSMPDRVEAARQVKEILLRDPLRPKYHFIINGNGCPGDANGAFWFRGRYHLMYLYCRPQGYCWGHVSSADLLHWRCHSDALGVGPVDTGCYSGGAFVDDDGSAYLSYWMLRGAKGIGLAKSCDAGFETWTKFDANPVIKSTHWGWTLTRDANGREVRYASADPSNIWKKDGRYYMLTGNLCLLDDTGRRPDSPEEMKGDAVYLFESKDLQTWTYRHPFYQRRTDKTRADGWTDADEDNMCPSFLPLSRADGRPSGKHLLLFISHNRGCQYYIGTYDTAADRFLPESHGRMTWSDKTYFAPEALLDGKGRQIAWTWLWDNLEGDLAAQGWTGVYALPRKLWLREDGSLGIAPVEELDNLRMNGTTQERVRIEPGARRAVQGVPGECCELEVVCDAASAANLVLDVRASADGKTKARIRYDAAAHELVFDGSCCGTPKIRSFCAHVPVERAPLTLEDREKLSLRVYVDGPVVEVFANGRQAICRRVYPEDVTANAVFLSAEGGPVELESLRAWEMAPTNPF